MLTGSLVALVTPMLADGALDLPRFRTLIDWHIEQGTDGLVIVGTTGESPTVSTEEHCLLIRTAVEQAAGRVPVIAGTGANSTTEAIELTHCAKAAGAAAGLSVAPYYNKPTQEGLYQHFKAIAEAADLPLILYNVPGRTVADISNETALRLAKLPGVIGIKDATGNIERGTDLLKRAPPSFAILSGDDATALALTMIEMAPDHPVTKHYSVGYWKGGDQAVEEILYTPRNIEKILAWGGPSSMRQVRKYLVPGLDLIALDPKVSGSMIGPEAFLSQETLEYVANQIAKDVGLLNQAACLNARVVYVECGTDASGLQKINRLGELVHAAVQSLPSNLSSCSPEFPAKLREDIDGLRQSSSFRVIGVEHSEGGVIVSQQSEPVHFKDELNGRVVNLVPVDKIEQALKWVTIDTQTIGVYPESLKDQIRDRCALQGVQRLTTLGCATSEAGGYPHDGIELFRRMVRWVVIENFERKVFDHGASVMRAQ